MANTIEDRLLTAAEAAAYLGLKEGSVRNKANRRELPFIRLGPTLQHPLRFRKTDLDRWIAEQNASTPPEAA